VNPHPYMYIGLSPVWVWVGALIVAVTCLALFAVFFLDVIGPKPAKRIALGDTSVELWEQERKMPGGADGIVVPVAPNMKMSTGISKWVRDATAQAIQYEALRVAPMQPGQAFVGSGGRYRFGAAGLAVVMDDQKRTSPEWIRSAVASALVQMRDNDALSFLLPDMTEDLLRQPKSISEDQRKETCRPIARAMLEGVVDACQTTDIDVVKIWAWRGNRDIWEEELARLAEANTSTGHAHALPA
jgi:hypothetical protein